MPAIDKPLATLVPRSFGVLLFKNGLVWCATILGVAIAAKASTDFTYELIVLTVGLSLSWSVVEATSRRFRSEAAPIGHTGEVGGRTMSRTSPPPSEVPFQAPSNSQPPK